MKAGMIIACVAIVSVGFLPHLPSPIILFFLSMLACIGFFARRFRLLIPLCLGALWASSYGHLGLSQQLPSSLEGVDLWVEGEVYGLPKVTPRSQRFELEIKDIELPEDFAGPFNLKRVRVNWYQFEQRVEPGERWRLQLRLKRPHGFANLGGFDYEGWLFRQGIGATGYVRQHEDNRRLLASGVNRLIDQWRYRLFKGLAAHLQSNPLFCPSSSNAICRANS